jgi:AICAR transformylase/IMP cyclohydrolase PurH
MDLASDYGLLVLYNGVRRSCEVSNKSAEFLVRALYSVISKENATQFFVKGIKDMSEGSDEERAKSCGISVEMVRRAREADEMLRRREKNWYVENAKLLMQKRTKIGHIERYKDLEIAKSIIFKHLKNHC